MCEICCIPYEESPHVRISADGLDRQFNGVSNSEMRSLYYALILTYPAYRKMHMDPINTVDRDGVSSEPVSSILYHLPTISRPPPGEFTSTSSIQLLPPTASRHCLRPASEHHPQMHLSTVSKCSSPASCRSAASHNLWSLPSSHQGYMRGWPWYRNR